eukprot:9521135-Prorocentrum_lima.AAC.1
MRLVSSSVPGLPSKSRWRRYCAEWCPNHWSVVAFRCAWQPVPLGTSNVAVHGRHQSSRVAVRPPNNACGRL